MESSVAGRWSSGSARHRRASEAKRPDMRSVQRGTLGSARRATRVASPSREPETTRRARARWPEEAISRSAAPGPDAGRG
eukprot:11392839-Alexandrium_andersonii.AAC.1